MAILGNKDQVEKAEMTSMIDVIFLLLIFFLVTLNIEQITGQGEQGKTTGTSLEEISESIKIESLPTVEKGIEVGDSLSNAVVFVIEEFTGDWQSKNLESLKRAPELEKECQKLYVGFFLDESYQNREDLMTIVDSVILLTDMLSKGENPFMRTKLNNYLDKMPSILMGRPKNYKRPNGQPIEPNKTWQREFDTQILWVAQKIIKYASQKFDIVFRVHKDYPVILYDSIHEYLNENNITNITFNVTDPEKK